MQKNFIPNKTALITLIAACLVVIISLGIRQTFGLFFFDFEIDLGCTQTEFGFAMGIQLLFWEINFKEGERISEKCWDYEDRKSTRLNSSH